VILRRAFMRSCNNLSRVAYWITFWIFVVLFTRFLISIIILITSYTGQKLAPRLCLVLWWISRTNLPEDHKSGLQNNGRRLSEVILSTFASQHGGEAGDDGRRPRANPLEWSRQSHKLSCCRIILEIPLVLPQSNLPSSSTYV
jgi:hypothetical protein